MSDTVIKVEGLGKRYRLGQYVGGAYQYRALRDVLAEAMYAPFRRLRSTLSHNQTNQTNETNQKNQFIWALKDVFFEVKQGEVVGIIGRNGAGKSTLLKLLSRIIEPTEGRAEVKGRIRSLLEVGTGFHPELTGRENIYLSGAVLGMTKKEINRKFDEIVDFSGIEKFIDTPVKRYSSGMRVRLGFAVAAHLEPEILLIDEVLAVGDIEFQRKCLGKMEEITGEGRTILFVSHNMPSIEALCHRAILLQDGAISFCDDAAATVRHYLGKKELSASSYVDLRTHPGRTTKCKPIFQSIRLLNNREEETKTFQVGDGIVFEMALEATERTLKSPNVYVVIFDSQERRICQFATGPMMAEPFEIAGRYFVRCYWNTCQLKPGIYSVALNIKGFNERLDRIFDASAFEVNPGDIYGTGKFDTGAGVFLPDGRWEFKQLSQ